ncbi:unnamed protein product [Linum tenue]|uniref:Uncharacterized protein n=1 Tax=Linum tenue TaxID=586396 RepID=A0AAV0LGR1_9ROSI|nr:unnamed protein product [Linum tenue]
MGSILPPAASQMAATSPITSVKYWGCQSPHRRT